MVDTTTEAVVLSFSTTLPLALVLVVAGDVGGDIIRPSKELLADQGSGGPNRSLLD